MLLLLLYLPVCFLLPQQAVCVSFAVLHLLAFVCLAARASLILSPPCLYHRLCLPPAAAATSVAATAAASTTNGAVAASTNAVVAAAAGFVGRDLHKPSFYPPVPEAGGLCCIFCFLSAATAAQLLLDRQHHRVRLAAAAASYAIFAAVFVSVAANCAAVGM